MSNLELVPAGTPEERAEVAAYLVALAKEKGIHPRNIRKGRGGWLVPSELLEVDGERVLSVEAPVEPAEKEAPDWYNEPGPSVDVEVDEVGDLVLTTAAKERILVEFTENATKADREEIRAWAKEAGLEVSDKGALKKAVIEAYEKAHEA